MKVKNIILLSAVICYYVISVAHADDSFLGIDFEEPGYEVESSDDYLEAVDSYQEAASDEFDSFASSLDNFFASEHIYSQADEPRAKVRFRAGYQFAADGRSEFKKDFHAQIPLKNTRKRLGILLGTFPDEDEDQSITGNQDESDFFLGLGGVAKSWKYTDLAWVAGLKFKPSPEFLTGPKLRHVFHKSDDWVVNGSEFLFWESDSDSGFGETTRLDVDRVISDEMLVRFRNQATWAEKSNGVEHFSRLTYFEQYSEKFATAVSLKAEGETEPSWVMTRYQASALFRVLAYKNWFYVEVEPALDFFRDDDYDISPGVTVMFEVNFERVPKYLREKDQA